MMYGYYDYYPFHMFSSIFMVLFWVAVLIILLRFLRGNQGYGRWGGRNEESHAESRALDILKERYAKGELTREQFEQMKKDLQ